LRATSGLECPISSATRVISSPRMMSDEAKKCRSDFVAWRAWVMRVSPTGGSSLTPARGKIRDAPHAARDAEPLGIHGAMRAAV